MLVCLYPCICHFQLFSPPQHPWLPFPTQFKSWHWYTHQHLFLSNSGNMRVYSYTLANDTQPQGKPIHFSGRWSLLKNTILSVQTKCNYVYLYTFTQKIKQLRNIMTCLWNNSMLFYIKDSDLQYFKDKCHCEYHRAIVSTQKVVPGSNFGFC